MFEIIKRRFKKNAIDVGALTSNKLEIVRIPYNDIQTYANTMANLCDKEAGDISRTEFGVSGIYSKSIRELYIINNIIRYDVCIDSIDSLRNSLPKLKRLTKSKNPKVQTIANNHYAILRSFINQIDEIF